ncbi:hypothetical protein [Vibrio salinus]|uniref:hypothetical protein n=1 Tax=Vibrio salinus TaxID=2899784 RepID=UPI001E4F4D85|nr:hypothetical protein [Vibrio salinus]MCE0495555.1 hypothetical protein [Vibrio salinus]
MIYTVECDYSSAETEAAWNDFYTLNKLPALIHVNGFLTSQRFITENEAHPAYLAVHSIRNADILISDDYRRKGGGNFAKWQDCITNWRRNTYCGIQFAPPVNNNEYLLLSTKNEPILSELGINSYLLQATSLDKNPEKRWLAKIHHSQWQSVNSLFSQDTCVYRPLTTQLTAA